RGIVPFTHLAREGRMTVTIGRRELLAALGGAAAWPLAARAQQGERMRRIGVLETISAPLNAANYDALRQGLRELGYVGGRNLVIEIARPMDALSVSRTSRRSWSAATSL